ncbi:MAG: DUF4404 family protein [Gammaproteobacteria bacterium]
MSRAELEHSLDKLRGELDALGPEASETRARLAALIDEIEQELATLETAADGDSLLEKLQHQVEVFEVEHPRVTNILNDIMVTLSNLGI